MEKKIGVLLINLGTPQAPTEEALTEFLAEFLSDPLVVDFPSWLWKPILNRIILKVRPAKSAQLYAEIWEEAGSPLLTISQSIAGKLQARHPGIPMALGMRYGSPDINNALRELKQHGVDHLVIFPLFPQYSSTTTQTAVEHARRQIETGFEFSRVTVIEDYHDHPAYIAALADSIKRVWADAGKTEKLLFSFHGIPQRYISRRGEPYAEQCQRTADLVSEKLDLSPGEYIVGYQSRFGPGKWLEPATDQVLAELGEAQCSGLSVVCPGFAADCLETLEEIAAQGKQDYEGAGGSGFQYLPCLNDSEAHIEALAGILSSQSG
ncbi:MAG: ferrochelatase [Chloroflexota bacterium]